MASSSKAVWVVAVAGVLALGNWRDAGAAPPAALDKALVPAASATGTTPVRVIVQLRDDVDRVAKRLEPRGLKVGQKHRTLGTLAGGTASSVETTSSGVIFRRGSTPPPVERRSIDYLDWRPTDGIRTRTARRTGLLAFH
jgi:hypothetical protein